MKSVFKLTAKKELGRIPKFFEIKVETSFAKPVIYEIQDAIKKAGFTDAQSLAWGGYYDSWLMEKIM